MATSSRVKEIIAQGDKLFEERRPLLPLWQTFAEQFYPIRADFTTSRYLGEEFASHLMTGRPVLAHRDLGNALSSILRPRGSTWFKARTDREDLNNDIRPLAWLDHKSDVMRRVMYDQRAQFVRATKQGDNDFAAFGQTVIQVEPNRDADGALYRNWHLRDCVWSENSELVIDEFHRDWDIKARDYVKLFPNTAARQVTAIADREPYKKIKCRHVVLPADAYDLPAETRGRKRHPFVSLYIDIDNDTMLEEMPRKRLGYVIPRWVTVSGSQYAYSPATIVSLPEAQLVQQMTLTLLEAGQKAVDPPLKATREAVQGGVNWYAGGVTWIDAEYDERLGSAIEPLLDTGRYNLNAGVEREQKIEALIREAFFLDVIFLPSMNDATERTKYEMQIRFEEYIRRALPLFEPMEIEYNGGLCEETFELCMDLGAFGSLADMPRELRGQDIRWQFESPLQAANDRAKAQAFTQSAQLLAEAAALDPTVKNDFDVVAAFRDALPGAGAPAKWIVPKDDADKARQADAERMQMEQAAAAVAQGAQVAQQVGDAGQALNAAQGDGAAT
jgi:hypothetical protein